MNKDRDKKKTAGSQLADFQMSQRWLITRWMHILRPAIVTATLGTAILIYPKGMIDKTPITIFLIGTYLLTFLYFIAHRITGVNLPLLATEIAFDIFLITAIIHYTGNLESSFVGLYFLSIMCASFFFRRRITILFTTLTALFYSLYITLYLNLSGEETAAIVKYNVTIQIILYCIVMFVVGILSSSFSERIIKKDTALISALRLLKEAQLDTSDILQSMTNGLLTITMSGYIIYSNSAVGKILDLEHESPNGKRYDLMLGDRAWEMADIIRKELARSAGMIDYEITVYDRDGRAIPIGMTVVPLYDTDKSRRGIIINFRDLTEKNKLLEMVRQADRMAAIGELSAAIAHEIRNPLASITNAVELLREDAPHGGDSQMGNLLNIIEKESSRLQRISTDFLTFARVKEPDIKPVHLKNTIEDILLLIENDPRKTKSISIRNLIDDELIVLFDEDHLKQFFFNIIINSLDALDGSGEIVIAAEKTLGLDPAYIRLVIYDTGPGIPDIAAGHIFEPFFSTKPEGTGLGLAFVRKLVIANRGRILAQNREGAGAEIALDIPLYGDV